MKPHDAKQKEMKKRHTNKKRARSESNHHAEMLMEINLRVHPLRFLHDTCQIDMVCARKFVHFDFVLQLESHAELNTKTTLVVITRAKGTVYSRGKKSRPLVSTKIKYVTDGHPKRITKSGQNQLKIVHCALNREYLSKFPGLVMGRRYSGGQDWDWIKDLEEDLEAVSYTHLTLPTNREV